jgi:hypothetical protein
MEENKEKYYRELRNQLSSLYSFVQLYSDYKENTKNCENKFFSCEHCEYHKHCDNYRNEIILNKLSKHIIEDVLPEINNILEKLNEKLTK